MRNEQTITRDGNCQSPWQEIRGSIPPVKAISDNEVSDCLIVGAGITGLTAALLLQKAGKKTVIAEKHMVGFGTTGGTSAHINTFADTTYKEAASAFGEDGARLFARAINEGLRIIKENVSSYKIDCDFEEKPGFLYAENSDQVKQLKDIFDGAELVGVPVQYTTVAPAPVPYEKALEFPGQAQFHPLKYLQALQNEYIHAGGQIFAHCKVTEVTTQDGIHLAKTGEATLKAKNILYCTHLPPNINVFNFRCAPYRSYVMAVRLKSGKYPDALVYDMQEPYHYIRSHTIDQQQLLIVGGLDHKTGHEDPEQAFGELEKYIRKHYNISSIKYKWSSQYYVPVDGLPYIGQMPLAADGIYCATGFNGNGMMLGTISGKILADLVSGWESDYIKIFSPSRIKPVDGFSEFVKENADVAYHLVADRMAIHSTDSIKRIKPGTGKVIEIDGKKIAAYRDDSGEVHALNPVCTHAACIVNWNGEEKSWDCPCHGARYDIDGKVITGPATMDLQNYGNLLAEKETAMRD